MSGDVTQHHISVVCTDYFAPTRYWVAMCWCGKYKTDRLGNPEDAAERAAAHLRAKGVQIKAMAVDDPRSVTCPVCKRGPFRRDRNGKVGHHGDGVHWPTRRCEGVGGDPAVVLG